MRLVVLRCYNTAGDYDGPGGYCYFDCDPKTADLLATAVEVVRGLKTKQWPFQSTYGIESFATPATVFNERIWPGEDEAPLPQDDPVRSADGTMSLVEFMDDADDTDPFVCAQGATFDTDQDTIRTGTETVVITNNGVLFQFSQKHSAGACESHELSYGWLLELAGRGPRPLEVTWQVVT